MATEICVTVEDDGSFTVEAEEKQVEDQEEGSEDTGNEQQFKTIDEALAAVKQMAEQASLAPPQDEAEPMPEEGGEPPPTAPGEEEDAAMMQNFRPGSTGR